MNLYDLVHRNDRMADFTAGQVEAVERKMPGGGQRGVAFKACADLRLRAAHEATALRGFPTHPGWTLHREDAAGFSVLLEVGGASHLLFKADPALPVQDVRLQWPAPTPMSFDLRIVSEGASLLTVGPMFNAKARLIPRLQGRGVEVGPGANPTVLPEVTREVSYVERFPMEQWAATYAKKQPDASAAALWDRYVIDSAHHLNGFDDRSIQFVFSSHVLEHLVNPLGVLTNWWTKLSSGGVIAGVVPDARFTFDLRQPLTTRSELIAQLEAGSFEPSESMYERWCRYTSPENTPSSLRARDYSIHVNYFSADSFRHLLDLFSDRNAPAGLFIESARNGKDFGFLIEKP